MSESQGQGAAATTTTEEGSLLDQVLAETRLAPSDEGYDVAKRGVEAFIAEMLTPGSAARRSTARRSTA